MDLTGQRVDRQQHRGHDHEKVHRVEPGEREHVQHHAALEQRHVGVIAGAAQDRVQSAGEEDQKRPAADQRREQDPPPHRFVQGEAGERGDRPEGAHPGL